MGDKKLKWDSPTKINGMFQYEHNFFRFPSDKNFLRKNTDSFRFGSETTANLRSLAWNPVLGDIKVSKTLKMAKGNIKCTPL